MGGAVGGAGAGLSAAAIGGTVAAIGGGAAAAFAIKKANSSDSPASVTAAGNYVGSFTGSGTQSRAVGPGVCTQTDTFAGTFNLTLTVQDATVGGSVATDEGSTISNVVESGGASCTQGGQSHLTTSVPVTGTTSAVTWVFATPQYTSTFLGQVLVGAETATVVGTYTYTVNSGFGSFATGSVPIPVTFNEVP